MKPIWDKRHGVILSELFNLLTSKGIRFFVLRNYEGLPDINSSKDVDIIIDPMKITLANKIFVDVLKKNGFAQVCFFRYGGGGFSYKAINLKNEIAIHIDLIGGYRMVGYEVFNFDELYEQTKIYKDFRVLNDYYDGLMLFIYKLFGYKKPQLKQEYKEIIYKTYKSCPQFEYQLSYLVGKNLSKEILYRIERNDFDGLIALSGKLTKNLKCYCIKKDFLGVIYRSIYVYWLLINQIVINRHKFHKSFSINIIDKDKQKVFLDALNERLCFWQVIDCDVESVIHTYPKKLSFLSRFIEESIDIKYNRYSVHLFRRDKLAICPSFDVPLSEEVNKTAELIITKCWKKL